MKNMKNKKKWWSYEAYLDTGFAGAEYTEEIDLRDYFTEEEWEAMDAKKRGDFFEKEKFAEDLMHDQIEIGVRHTDDKEENF